MMTGAVDGEIVCGRNGKPLPLRSIGAVVWYLIKKQQLRKKELKNNSIGLKS
jgi:hypothetical protein